MFPGPIRFAIVSVSVARKLPSEKALRFGQVWWFGNDADLVLKAVSKLAAGVECHIATEAVHQSVIIKSAAFVSHPDEQHTL